MTSYPTGGDRPGGDQGISRRWWILFFVVIGVVALMASAVEIFHNTAAQVDRATNAEAATAVKAAGVPRAGPAVDYLGLAAQRRGANHQWASHLSQLNDVVPEPEVAEGRGERKLDSLASRATRRAYEGAPPTIPHAVEARSDASCLACHAEGLVLDGRVARPMSHPVYQSCTQCHVAEANPSVAASTLQVPNAFVGTRPLGEGAPRAWVGAPPVIPHTTLMRQACGSCHGPLGPPGLRTTHPERQSCTQCHAPSAQLDQRGWPNAAGGRW